MWLPGRQMEGLRSDDARGVVPQIALCYESVTVLSWFAARPIRVAENGPERRLTSIDTETTKKFFGRKILQNQKRKILTVSASVFCAVLKKFDCEIK